MMACLSLHHLDKNSYKNINWVNSIKNLILNVRVSIKFSSKWFIDLFLCQKFTKFYFCFQFISKKTNLLYSSLSCHNFSWIRSVFFWRFWCLMKSCVILLVIYWWRRRWIRRRRDRVRRSLVGFNVSLLHFEKNAIQN